MLHLTATLDQLANELAAATGRPAAWEVEKFQAPGFFLKPLRSEQPTMAGGWTIIVQLIAAVPDRKHRTVVADIERLIDSLDTIQPAHGAAVTHLIGIDGWQFDEGLELSNNLVLPAAAATAEINLF